MTSRMIAFIAILVSLIMTASLALTAIGLKINYDSSQNIHTLLINGRTASAISAKKTEALALDIKSLVTDLQKQQTIGQKTLPILLNEIENAIATQDVAAINKAVHDVEVYFAHHTTINTSTNIAK